MSKAEQPPMKDVFSAASIKATMTVVKQMAQEKGVPTLVETTTDDTAANNVTPLSARRARKVTPAPTQKKTIELPVYLWDEISMKAPKEKTTQRYLVLQAFKDAGYTVHDIDLFKDGRRGS